MREARVVFVFEGLDESRSGLTREFLNFLIELSNSTENLKIVIILHIIDNISNEIQMNFGKIEIGEVTQNQAIEYLTYLAHTENKM